MSKLPAKKVIKDPTLAQKTADQAKVLAAQAGESLEGTAAEIWGEIKDREILMFSLPNQRVHQHVTPFKFEPSKLYLRTASPAVLPSLENALGAKYKVELVERFVTVTRAPEALVK